MNLLQTNSVLNATYREDTAYLFCRLQTALSELCERPDREEAIKELSDSVHSLHGVSGLVQAWSVANVSQLWERLCEFLTTLTEHEPDEARGIVLFMFEKRLVLERLVTLEVEGNESEAKAISKELISQVRERYPAYLEGTVLTGESEIKDSGTTCDAFTKTGSNKFSQDSDGEDSSGRAGQVLFEEDSPRVIARINEQLEEFKEQQPSFDQLTKLHDDFQELRALSLMGGRGLLATVAEDIGQLTILAGKVKDTEPEMFKKVLLILDKMEPLLTGFRVAEEKEEELWHEAYEGLYDSLALQWPKFFKRRRLRRNPKAKKRAGALKRVRKKAATKASKKSVSRARKPASLQEPNPSCGETGDGLEAMRHPNVQGVGSGLKSSVDELEQSSKSSSEVLDFLEAVDQDTCPVSEPVPSSTTDPTSTLVSSDAASDFLDAMGEDQEKTVDRLPSVPSDEELGTSLLGADVKGSGSHPSRPAPEGSAADFLDFVQQADLSYAEGGTSHVGSSDAGLPKSAEISEEMLSFFYIEAAELLENIEREALAWERTPEDSSTVQSLFRLFHTLKGAANSMGVTNVGGVSHKLEDLLEAIVEQRFPERRKELSTLVLSSVDIVRKLVEDTRAKVHGKRLPELRRLEQGLEAYRTLPPLPGATVCSPMPAQKPLTSPESQEEKSVKKIVKKEESSVIRVTSQRLEKLMNLMGEVVISRSRLDAKILDILRLREELSLSRSRLVELVYGFQDRHEYSSRYASSAPLGSENDRAVKPGILQREGQQRGSEEEEDGFSELEFDRYDEFNILARNLVEIGADTAEIVSQLDRFFESLSDESSQFNKTTSQLQDEIVRIRMVPLSPLIQRLHRAVLDAGEKEGKQIEFESEGADTLLDKSIMDQLYTPLLHVVRNAVSHGIEDEPTRLALGKPAQGKVTVRAHQHSNQVVIKVSDDGQGLDFESIRDEAIRRGVVSREQATDQKLLTEFIFKIGFSTSGVLTDVSGRGIGMDVVRQEIKKLNGTIHVASDRGRGCTFEMRLPLSLSINEALIVRAGHQVFALPLHYIERVVKVKEEEIAQLDNEGDVVCIQDAWIPVLRLSHMLGMNEQSIGGLFVVVRVAEKRWAVQVSSVIRKQDIVVKPLGLFLNEHPFFFGVTLFGDGSMVMILDILNLIQASGGSLSDGSTQKVELEQTSPEVQKHGKVLVVDDSLSIRKIAENYVSELGFEVDLARDGLEALERLRGGRYDLVLTDLEMPRVHGFELIAEIRRNPLTLSTPILVVSSRDSEKHRRKAAELGANGFLVKPFSRDHLRHAFGDLLGQEKPTNV